MADTNNPANVPFIDPTPAPAPGTGAPAPTPDQQAALTPSDPQVSAGYSDPSAPPAVQSGPTVLIPQKRGGLGGIVDEIRNAVAPTTPQVYIDPNTGQRYVQHPPQSAGHQWARVAADAIGGAMRGAGVGPGPGKQGEALSAGFQGQEQQHIQQQAQQEQQADRDYQIGRQNRIDRANTYLQQYQMAKNEFELKQLGEKLNQSQVEFANHQEDREKALGSIDLGTYDSHYTMADVKKVHPEFWQDAVNGDIRSVPVPDADGNRTGVHLFLRKPSIGDQAADPGTQAYRFVPPANPGDAPTLQTFTPSGSHTVNDIDTYNGAAMKKMQDWQQENAKTRQANAAAAESAAKAQVAPSESAKNYAEAQKARSDSQNDSYNVNPQTAAMMVEGQLAPSQLSKRAKDYNAILPLANQYSQQKYGKPFDAEISESRYNARKHVTQSYADGKEADQIGSFNTFLGHAENLSNSVNGLRNTGSPLLNMPYNKLRNMSGDPAVKAILPQIEAVRTEYQNFLNNNHALHEDDIKEGHQMLDENASPAQMQAAMKSFGHVALTRVGALNDRYYRTMREDVPDLLSDSSVRALQHFGMGDQAARLLSHSQQSPQQKTQPPPPSPQTHIFSVSTWQHNNPGGDVQAAQAAAEAAHYQVVN